MTNTTTTTDKTAESYPGSVPEQMGKRAAVLTYAAQDLRLREFVVAEAAAQVNEGPVIDSSMTVEQQRVPIETAQPFISDDVLNSQNAKILALTPDLAGDAEGTVTSGRPNSDLFETAQAALRDIFGPGE